MKATIISFREGAVKPTPTDERHTFVVSFSDQTNAPQSELAKLIYGGIVAGGNTAYDATVDLVRIFRTNPALWGQVSAQNVYDPAKGLALAQSIFAVGTVVDDPAFNLFTIPLSECNDKGITAVTTSSGHTLTTYRRAGFFTREIAVEISKSAFAASIASGAFTPVATPTAAPAAGVNLATILGGVNAPI